jgi:hypothetical protein
MVGILGESFWGKVEGGSGEVKLLLDEGVVGRCVEPPNTVTKCHISQDANDYAP